MFVGPPLLLALIQTDRDASPTRDGKPPPWPPSLLKTTPRLVIAPNRAVRRCNGQTSHGSENADEIDE
jgi:hypothetical protein